MSGGVLKTFSLAEVAEHKVPNSYWIIIHGKVYDVTSFLDVHPGGRGILTKYSGGDASKVFDDVNHSGVAKAQMEKFLVGEISAADSESLAVAAKAAQTAATAKPLPKYTMFEVSNKRGPDSYWFVLSNKVLDVTNFGGDHPGGPEIIKYHSGTDATVAFKNNGHSMLAVDMSKKYIIGELVPEDCVQYERFNTREWMAEEKKNVKPSPVWEFAIRQLSIIVALIVVVYLAFVALVKA